MSRLATLSQGGKTLTYSRLTNSDRLDKAEFSPASAAPAVEYSYDTKLRLISKGCGTRSFTDKDEVWYFDCPAGTPGNWGTSRYYFYDSMGQLTLAGEGALGPDGQVDNPQNFSYDSIGNHLTNNETYSILNQGSGKTYDANGNMTRNGDDWVALYDGENRLRTVSHPYDGVELLYDYAGRIYQVNDFYMDGVDLPTSTLNYRRIYDGTKLIATVRNGEIQDTFVWQPETSGDADVILWDNSYVYATDPNKNVRVKRFPNDWIPGTWVEEFIDYKPFGELKNYVADPPRFMFSSEEYMPETGMYHYLYRAYSPSLARFITRDPIEEQGGVNLYCFVNNNPVSKWDRWGLELIAIEDSTVIYDTKEKSFREPTYKEKMNPSNILSGAEALKKIAEFSIEDKKDANKAFGLYLHTDSPYNIKVGNLLAIAGSFTDALIEGSYAFVTSKICIESLRAFKSLNCGVARKNAEACIDSVTDKLPVSIASSGAYLFTRFALTDFFDELNRDCLRACYEKKHNNEKND